MSYILSPQDVRIAQDPASIGARIGALLIDGFILGVYYIVFFNMVSSQMLDSLHWFFPILFLLCPLLYPLIAEVMFKGQTVGKSILNIRVITIEGSGPKLMSFILRWFMLPFDLFFALGIGELCVFFTKRQQRLGDLIAGTWVVRTKTHDKYELTDYDLATSADRANSKSASATSSSNGSMYPGAKNLTPQQSVIIAEALENRYSYNVNLAFDTLVPKVERIVGPSVSNSTEEYLQDVLAEYRNSEK